jgi:hypothetical protein
MTQQRACFGLERKITLMKDQLLRQWVVGFIHFAILKKMA